MRLRFVVFILAAPLVLLCLPFLFLVSCTRDPIYDEVSQYRISFDMDRNDLYCQEKDPELIQVVFYDIQSGKKIRELYMGPEGGYLYDIQPGDYAIVAFGMDAGRTDIEYTKDLNLLRAQTKVLQKSPEKIINSPQHRLVGTVIPATIPYLSEADEPCVLNIPMSSPCDSWKVTVTGIKGLQFASSVNLYLSNQVCEVSLKEMKGEGLCTINVKDYQISAQEGLLEIPFCTFGMSPEGPITARLVIEAHDRQFHSQTYDVSSQVRDPGNTQHSIMLDFQTELLPLVQGGLDPQADEWDEHREHIDVL